MDRGGFLCLVRPDNAEAALKDSKGTMTTTTRASQEPDYRGLNVLVVGAARSGIAAAEFLLSCNARVVLTDNKSASKLGATLSALQQHPNGRNLSLELGEHRTSSFRDCDLVIMSPGVPLTLPLLEGSRKAGVPVVGEVELASRHLKGTLLAITGSNGKTTTTALVAEFLCRSGLRGHAAGNIGAPLVQFVRRSRTDDIYATELSSFQLESIRDLRPKVAAILNLTPDHMDRYSSFDAYVASKRRIFMNQDEGDFAVLNADDPRTMAMIAEVRSTAVCFSRKSEVARGTMLHKDNVFYRDDDTEWPLFALADVALKGTHNLENVLAASAVALLAGADRERLREVVQEFGGIEHRLELVAEIGGAAYFNDSKATNVDATAKSLESFPSGVHLILGGRDKGGDFSRLRSLVEQRVRTVYLLGEASGKIREALEGTTEIIEVSSLMEAVEIAHQTAEPGDTVLLAPGCASFDMFRSFEHRGQVFKESVLSHRRHEGEKGI